MVKAGKCPICAARTETRWRPFCSKRCADVDLNRWLSGRYAIPVVDHDEEEEGSEATPPEADGNGIH